ANAASGIDVHDDCKQRFLELKAKRTFCFVVYKIKEKDKQKKIIVEKLVPICRKLPIDDFNFVTAKNCQKASFSLSIGNYLRKCFFSCLIRNWVRTKMICASSKERFKRELDEIQVEWQTTDLTEMDLEVISELFKCYDDSELRACPTLQCIC
ncbi:hypothetical protein MKW94_026516, partial [Papaver nudicaule]|nr:hypothetical protein [Papaver nudicaule]